MNLTQVDPMLPWVFSVADHRRIYNVVRTSVTHLRFVCHFFYLLHFDVICDVTQSRRTETWNLFVNWQYRYTQINV